jgi:coniferyl-aldehyde dehydrogenase
MYPSPVKDPEYTSMASDRHANRVRELLADAQMRGATIVACGEGDGKRIIPMYILTGVTPDMRILKEELFAPILPVLECGSIEQAICYVAGRPRPLALYYYGTDDNELQRLTQELHAGGMTVNEWVWHVFQCDLPFGGSGNSGMGSWKGPEGFRSLSHAKPVFTTRRWFPMGLFRPPYGNLLQRLTLKLWLGSPQPPEEARSSNRQLM